MKMLNSQFPEFPTKAKARAHVKSLGYTELYDVTESGDHGYGSREYYRKPLKNLFTFSRIFNTIIPEENDDVQKLSSL